jgi:hypothetical protein
LPLIPCIARDFVGKWALLEGSTQRDGTYLRANGQELPAVGVERERKLAETGKKPFTAARAEFQIMALGHNLLKLFRYGPGLIPSPA